MNIYDDFFKGITPEEWEFFATDFLSSLGYIVIELPARGADGGKDAIVGLNGMRYIVSCKHFILSGDSVSVDDEKSLVERIIQHNAVGFIGFYSTVVSQALQDRFIALQQNSNYDFRIFDKHVISNYIPNMNCFIIQKYGQIFNHNFVNPNISMYLPLPCMVCSKDILANDMPQLSLAGMTLNTEGRYMYVWGCKEHLHGYVDVPFIVGSQTLHSAEMNSWGNLVTEFSKTHPIASDFWENFSLHQNRVLQVQYPSNFGFYPTSLIE